LFQHQKYKPQNPNEVLLKFCINHHHGEFAEYTGQILKKQTTDSNHWFNQF